MQQSTKKSIAFVTAFLMVSVFAGCDLFSPPKKAVSKPAETKPIEQTQPATNTTAVNENQPLPADVIARVGSWSMSVDEFNDRLKILKQGLPEFNEKDTQTKATVLNELIRQQLMVKDAEGSDIVEQKDIKDAVEDFRRTLLVQKLAERITKGIAATQEDAQKYYDQNKNLFIKWKVRQINVADEAAAKNILVQVLQGGDFAALAKAQSKDKYAAEGGLIDDPAQAPLEVQKNITALDTGGTSAVFKGPQGYYIVHVDEKTYVAFADVKEELKSRLTVRKQQEAILEYIDKLAQKTKVEVNKELLGVKESK